MQHQARQLILLIVVTALLTACAPFRVDDRQIAGFRNQHRVVVVNFWATWCEPCVEEIPIFIKLRKAHPDAEFIGVSMDDLSPESEAHVRKFAQDHGINYRIVQRDGQDFESMVNSMDPDWIGGLPATFVFRDGKRVFSKTGPVKEPELAAALKS